MSEEHIILKFSFSHSLGVVVWFFHVCAHLSDLQNLTVCSAAGEVHCDSGEDPQDNQTLFSALRSWRVSPPLVGDDSWELLSRASLSGARTHSWNLWGHCAISFHSDSNLEINHRKRVANIWKTRHFFSRLVRLYYNNNTVTTTYNRLSCLYITGALPNIFYYVL